MRAKKLIPAAFVILIAIGALLFFNTAPTSRPALVFKGYEVSAINSNAIAKLESREDTTGRAIWLSAIKTNVYAQFELRNTTGRAIWLYYCGYAFPLRPSFVERPTIVPAKPTNDFETNAYSLHVGHFYQRGEQVLPGDTVQLKLLLRSEEPAKHVGINYYFGKFSDGNDFLDHLLTPVLVSKADWKVKALFLWQRLRGKFKAPERHEIWCGDLLSFRDAMTNASQESSSSPSQ